MKRFLYATLFAALFALSVPDHCFGQHADIEFGFDDFTNPTTIEVELAETTSDGIQIAEAEFDDLFNDLATQDPGFITAADEGLRVNPGDEVSVLFLDAATNSAAGQGFVSFYNPATDALEAGGSISISNQAGDVTVLNGATQTGNSELVLSLGSDGTLDSNAPDPADNVTLEEGEIHNHLTFDLDDATASTGAFGILLQFQADVADANGGLDGIVDYTSDPFFLIFNNELTEEDFENLAVPSFSEAAVPEPSSALVLGAIAGGILTRRRRRT